MLKMMKRWALAATLCAAAATFAHAQSTTQGAIAGTIFDATDAIVPNATIVIRNDGTNAEQRLTTDSAGYFRAPQLPPGTYTVTITAPGFSEIRSHNVTVQVNLVTQLDQHLQTGSTAQTVEVTAEVPVLNFDSPTFGGHLSNVEIENIPMNNRRWSTLALLTPGATVDTNGFGLIQFRAISPLLNNVQIDGADDNQAFFAEERGRTRAGYSTSQAAVREFTVNSGVYSAEFGRAVGGVVNSVTKSGTNALHGELYFYNRNSSRSAFQPLTTITTFDAASNQYVTTPYKPKDNRNQFGFGVGGPLIKDKLFWFYAFDMYRRNFPGTAKVNTPSAFFTAPTPLQSGQVCNTTTGKVSGSGVSTINNAGCLLAARLGVTYDAASTLYNQQLQAILTNLGSVPRYGDQEINTPKLDWQINNHNQVSFLYHRLRWDSPGGVQTQSTNNYAIDSFGTDFVKLDYGVAKLNSVYGRWVNELRYQYGRELNNEGRQDPSSYTKSNLTNSTGVPIQLGLLSSATQIGLTMGTPYYSFRYAYPDERKWQVGDTAATIWGRHNVKFGVDIVHNYDLQNNLYEGNGYYNYSSTIVNYFSDLLSKGKTCDAALSGVGSFPCYNNVFQGFGPQTFALSTLDYGFFVQDDYKITPRLTLNLGLRYDYEKLPAPFNGLTTIAQTTNHPSDKNNFSPRVGFAWDPYGLGKTVVRGGYGMYYGRIPNAVLLNAFQNTGSPNSQAAYTFSSTTAGAPTLPNIASAPPSATAAGPNIQYLANNMQNPMTHQFDLVVQQELGWGSVFSVSYIGALGRQLPNFLNLNLSNDNSYIANYTVTPATSGGTCGPIACGTVISSKVYASKKQNGATASSYDFITPNKNFGAITAVQSNVNSNYHALSVELQKRANKLLSFDALYTWSHALDFNQNASTSASTNNWYDPLGNGRLNYANSNFNIPHRIVTWALLNLPGVSEGSSWKYLANGWSLKPLLQAQSGLPYSVTVGGTTPSQCYVKTCLQPWGSGLGGTSVTYIPQVGRNTFQYPWTIVADLRVQKDFLFAEKYNLQLMAEAFNLPNHQNITGLSTQGYSNTVTPGTGTNAPASALTFQPTYGSVTTANSNYAYGPRQIQLAARFVF
jgi:Carboxypeptidase regulatory-like domain/TonB dependent receptor